MSGFVLLAVVVVLMLWAIGAYNRLIALKAQVANAWKQIDVQLRRRHDRIPNLVGATKGALQFERETLEAVIAARTKAVAVTGVAATARAEGELTQALGKRLSRMMADPSSISHHPAVQSVNVRSSRKIKVFRRATTAARARWTSASSTVPTRSRIRATASSGSIFSWYGRAVVRAS